MYRPPLIILRTVRLLFGMISLFMILRFPVCFLCCWNADVSCHIQHLEGVAGERFDHLELQLDLPSAELVLALALFSTLLRHFVAHTAF